MENDKIGIVELWRLEWFRDGKRCFDGIPTEEYKNTQRDTKMYKKLGIYGAREQSHREEQHKYYRRLPTVDHLK